MTDGTIYTELRRTFEWTCPECGSDHYDVGEVEGQILTCEGCSQAVLVRWPGLPAEGAVSVGSGGSCQHVAEEPEWETEYASGPSSQALVRTNRRGDRYAHETAYERKVTPWVPVKQEGAQ